MGQLLTFHLSVIGPVVPPFQNDFQVIRFDATAFAALGFSLSPLTPTIANGRPFIRSTSATSPGTMAMHGPHHEAQKLSTTTLPR